VYKHSIYIVAARATGFGFAFEVNVVILSLNFPDNFQLALHSDQFIFQRSILILQSCGRVLENRHAIQDSIKDLFGFAILCALPGLKDFAGDFAGAFS
jgi:hypothetical protein